MSGQTTQARQTPWRWLAATLIAGVTLLRLAYLVWWCPLDLAPDEAHYWDWSRRLDLSYYSKGPLIAYLIRLGCWVAGDWSRGLVGSEMIAVRLPAVVCGALLLAAVYELTRRVYADERLAFAVTAGAVTLPLVAAGATLMTIDAPYTCCWAWALVLAHRAIFDRKPWAWPALGLVVGAGILAKYTMVLWFPSLACFLLFTPGYRRLLLRPGWWSSVLVAGLCCLPILVWNVRHDWLGLRHVEQQAGLRLPEEQFRWAGPLLFVGTQFGLLLGFWFLVWARGMLAFAPWRRPTDVQRFLWWTSAPVFLLFLAFSPGTAGGKPNWAVTAYLSGLVLGVGWFTAELRRVNPRQRQALQFGLGGCALAGLLLTAHLHLPQLTFPALRAAAGEPTPARPLPLRTLDPTSRLQGWRTLAAAVDERVRRLRAEGVEPVVACGAWTYAGELGFYCREAPEIYYLGVPLGCRRSQYDLWTPNPVADPERYAGRTFLFVGEPVPVLAGAFERVGPAEAVLHYHDGYPVAEWKLSVCRSYRGFSYDLGFNQRY